MRGATTGILGLALGTSVASVGFWIGAALLAAAWPAALAFGPLGTATRGLASAALPYELAFMGCTLGVALGVLSAPKLDPFLIRAGPLQRLQLQWTWLVGRTLLLAGAACAPGLVLGAATGAGLGDLAGPLALVLLHTTALGLVLVQLPLPAAARAALLPALNWLLPALVAPGSGVGRLVHGVLAAPGLPTQAPETVWVRALWKGEMGPIIGMVLAALLLARRPAPLHALRHPG